VHVLVKLLQIINENARNITHIKKKSNLIHKTHFYTGRYFAIKAVASSMFHNLRFFTDPLLNNFSMNIFGKQMLHFLVDNFSAFQWSSWRDATGRSRHQQYTNYIATGEQVERFTTPANKHSGIGCLTFKISLAN
jgi:hypothetical protein